MGESHALFDANRVKHLEMTQATITRLANSSFLIKGWLITLTAAMFVVSVGQHEWTIALSSLVPIVAFWLVDASFLKHERAYRSLYDRIRQADTTVELFSMDTSGHLPELTVLKVALSFSLAFFYLPFVVLAIAFAAIAAS